ncbi:MAG TPA: flagellar basal body rod protein FlgB [Pirellulaceae bacterium]|nr:flagellar basal body rod protein FlgB [Pirellulaceae bacterium]
MDAMFPQFRLLSHALDFASQNHRVISQNLANINTPNYQARQLSFEQFLDHIQKGHRSEPPPQYDVHLTAGLTARADGNNVDLDAELGNLKRNDLTYQALNELLGAKFEIMKAAIKG